MYQIRLKKKAEKELRKLPKNILLHVVASIDDLHENPKPSGSKKLKGSSENMYRLRQGDYRVIYVIEEEIKIISVRKIAHRKDVYKM